MKRIRFWSRKLYRRAIQEVASRVYVNPETDPRNSILVAGTARSGTTWLGDIIASKFPSRILFEPFNPNLVSEYRRFHYFQYMRPGIDDPEFYTFAQKVFTGAIRNRWIDHQNERMISRFRLVKEIRINLALKWLHDHFPEVPILFIIRHPCAVVLSRMELGWATDGDINSFMMQPALVDDVLDPYLDLIRNAKTDEQKHAVIWSISNLVPLRQFSSDELKIVYYEDLCTQPSDVLSEVIKTIGWDFSNLRGETIDHPSQTTRVDSAVVAGTDKVGNWKRKLSRSQIDNILRVVHEFGLGELYGDSLLPLKKSTAST